MHITDERPTTHKPEPFGFLPLEAEQRGAVPTAVAAYYLNRSPQTLRTWSSIGNGPIRPIRMHGRLAWPVAEIRKLLGVAK